MGLGLFRSTSWGRNIEPAAPIKGDPVPTNFILVKMLEIAPYVIAEIQYPDASNFEGRKIALYRSTKFDLQSAEHLDPHFNEAKGPLVPIARFEPTVEGWIMAERLAELLAR